MSFIDRIRRREQLARPIPPRNPADLEREQRKKAYEERLASLEKQASDNLAASKAPELLRQIERLKNPNGYSKAVSLIFGYNPPKLPDTHNYDIELLAHDKVRASVTLYWDKFHNVMSAAARGYPKNRYNKLDEKERGYTHYLMHEGDKSINVEADVDGTLYVYGSTLSTITRATWQRDHEAVGRAIEGAYFNPGIWNRTYEGKSEIISPQH